MTHNSITRDPTPLLNPAATRQKPYAWSNWAILHETVMASKNVNHKGKEQRETDSQLRHVFTVVITVVQPDDSCQRSSDKVKEVQRESSKPRELLWGRRDILVTIESDLRRPR